ncbi:Xyloglucan endotransglucosylase/hydrolase protein 20 [Wickerhamomyces ciferrii]|uniref:Xyloglucan endotransglucosylase/hydrolase protein 20 n=1 Tax=Wickerhamomyces ciferrii (strain ATCC 14091 / BCRC 22168 / CBS 111 / JCM 3599 / NBRC 0793 / NRRL Y-1031 F-60-10) TaxID=1206466 RepID=K0KNK1_WICCF|nr:Xyloglucan endotransglucosylase/hydrolase protein 20 [Wickerhamomyces ciferrii]CCH44571.1 Xyloglucan endotransglucosylase/hydrolase protein 20 [Wickerhamomyces ciferrii]
MPICKNITTTFENGIDGLVDEDKFLGDPEDGDWIYNGYVDSYDDSLLLAMPNQSSGTVLSSSRYVWFGKISATLKTSHLQGVVTAFILFSNAQDEIDFEFIGSELTTVESNYYYQAVLNYSNVRNATTSDTYENYHTYEVDWTPEELTWSLNGESFRTLKKEDTWNSSTNSYHYPQTPSRVQFSLWPGGDSDNSVGTIAWAGGAIDWDADDIKDYGYYYMLLKNVSIECYEAPEDTLIEGDVSYIFNSSSSFDQDDIVISDEETVLGSDEASGLDPDEGKSSSSSDSDSSTKSGSTKTSSGSTSTSGSDSDSDDSDSGSSSTTSGSGGWNQYGSSSSTEGSSSNLANSIGGSSFVSLLLSIMMIATAL